jgi:phage-related protein
LATITACHRVEHPFYESKRQIIFTHGFVKKEQKTPKGEIEKAISIRKALRGEK